MKKLVISGRTKEEADFLFVLNLEKNSIKGYMLVHKFIWIK